MSMTVDILKNYPNEVFVETGTYKGDGIQMALDCGFKYVVSFEASKELYEISERRFSHLSNVVIYNLDSRTGLRDVIPFVPGLITYWLDAHACGDAYFEDGRGGYNTIPTHQGKSSIIIELEQIQRVPNISKIILIDDWTIFGTREIETKLWDMGYNTEFIDGTRKQDILIAKK
jgi:hypothetical protein